MQPFSIQCTTCRRSLRVVNPEAIGQILSCPKCGSMVLVHAPAGWDLHTATKSSASGSDEGVATDPSAATPSCAAWTNPPAKPSLTPDPASLPVNHLEASTAAALAMLANTGQSARAPSIETTAVANAVPCAGEKIALEKSTQHRAGRIGIDRSERDAPGQSRDIGPRDRSG